MEEEILQEIEAVKAVYGSDCTVLEEIPPHLKVSLKPRTAEDLSQQFVEAVLVIRANTQYPVEPPEIELTDSKGLDKCRHSYLLSEIQNDARELAASPMLVSLCEAAIDRLSDMNHPEGNCSFCLFPLVMEDARSGLRPFMKLMSCFHCFHSDCFGRWWRWLQEQSRLESMNLVDTSVSRSGEIENEDEGVYSDSNSSSLFNKAEEWVSVNCPVCRKLIHVKDVEHVRQFLMSDFDIQENNEGSMVDNNFLVTDEEIKRREKFAEMFKVQKECGGIIEPKKLDVILPGMFLPSMVNASVEALDSGNQVVPIVEETNVGQGSVEATETVDSDIPSSSTSALSVIRTEMLGDHTTVEHSELGVRELQFGRHKNNFRRHYNQQCSHERKQHSRKNTGSQPEKTVWVKKE